MQKMINCFAEKRWELHKSSLFKLNFSKHIYESQTEVKKLEDEGAFYRNNCYLVSRDVTDHKTHSSGHFLDQ